jgi:7,8-dihydropterin-6-yl-methyl-4-(beta-D-ribofuranosyl)aminobenzene 5'-phosphate synthase
MKLTVLAENTVPTSFGLLGEHGFSVLVETEGESLLFDTGQHGAVVHNARTLGRDLSRVRKIVLSHGHYDHANGLEAVLRSAGEGVEIHAHPDVFKPKYVQWQGKIRFIGIKYTRAYLEDELGAVFHFKTKITEVAEDIWMTGEVPMTNPYEKIPEALLEKSEDGWTTDPFRDDNSLIIRTHNGLSIILGCAHRGMVNILEAVKTNFKEPVYAVIGGTHLGGASGEHLDFVKRYLKTEDIKLFAPGHCTGVERIMEFRNEFPAITQPAFCGSVFEI